MAIQTSVFGVLPDGEEVKRITIGDEEGFSVSILTYGAIIQSFMVPVLRMQTGLQRAVLPWMTGSTSWK